MGGGREEKARECTPAEGEKPEGAGREERAAAHKREAPQGYANTYFCAQKIRDIRYVAGFLFRACRRTCERLSRIDGMAHVASGGTRGEGARPARRMGYTPHCFRRGRQMACRTWADDSRQSHACFCVGDMGSLYRKLEKAAQVSHSYGFFGRRGRGFPCWRVGMHAIIEQSPDQIGDVMRLAGKDSLIVISKCTKVCEYYLCISWKSRNIASVALP